MLKPQNAGHLTKQSKIAGIRRGNLQVHLMYKAIFELSANRTEFVSRLFTINIPKELGSLASAKEIFAALHNSEPETEASYKQNLAEICKLLTGRHRFNISKEDMRAGEPP